MIYKNKNNELFVDPIISNHKDLIKITKKEFDKILLNKSKSTNKSLELLKSEKIKRINDLTDKKLNSGYLCSNGFLSVCTLKFIIELKNRHDLSSASLVKMPIIGYNNDTRFFTSKEVLTMLTELSTNYEKITYNKHKKEELILNAKTKNILKNIPEDVS